MGMEGGADVRLTSILLAISTGVMRLLKSVSQKLTVGALLDLSVSYPKQGAPTISWSKETSTMTFASSEKMSTVTSSSSVLETSINSLASLTVEVSSRNTDT